MSRRYGSLSLPRRQTCFGTLNVPLPPHVKTLLLAALDDGPQAVSLFDPDDRLTYGNSTYHNAWQVTADSGSTFASIMRHCHGTGVGALIATDDIEAWIASAGLRRRTGPASRAFEVDLCDGRWFWITERRLKDGWILSIGQDITALKHNENTLRSARDIAVRLSLTDPLTQLANRRRALNVLDERLAANQDFYLALIDIDHFKGFNDAFGHAVGDAVLTAVAARLECLGSSGCIVARLAGDEFAIIGPTDRDRAWFDQVLCGFMEATSEPIELCGHSICIRLSIGAACAGGRLVDAGALLAEADAALYEAKRGGRSTIRFGEI